MLCMHALCCILQGVLNSVRALWPGRVASVSLCNRILLHDPGWLLHLLLLSPLFAADYWPSTRDVPNNKFRDKSLSYMVGGGGHEWGDQVVGGMGG